MYPFHRPKSEDIDNLDFAALRLEHLLRGDLDMGSDFDDCDEDLLPV